MPASTPWPPKDLAAAGEVTGLRRSLLRCLLPRPSHGGNSSEEMMPDVATTAVKDTWAAGSDVFLFKQKKICVGMVIWPILLIKWD